MPSLPNPPSAIEAILKISDRGFPAADEVKELTTSLSYPILLVDG